MFPHQQTRFSKTSSKSWFQTYHSFSTVQADPPPPHWSTAVGSMFAGLWSDLHQWRAKRQAALMLRELNDHTLRDIGIHRCEIDAVIRNGNRD